VRTQPSAIARLIEWLLWRVDFKQRKFGLGGLRERALKQQAAVVRPPRSLYRRFQVSESVHRGRRVFAVSRQGKAARVKVLYLHGGGYSLSPEAPQWNIIAKLMRAAEVSVTVPLYPLAPEHTCEEVLAFALEVYAAAEREAGGLPLILAGDSAGGGLALAVAQTLRDAGMRQPERMVLICPWLDVTCCDPMQAELEKVDPILSIDSSREMGRWYAGECSTDDPRVSPLFGKFHDLPPTLVLTGTHDVLSSDARRLQARAAGIKWELRVSEYAGMGHDWLAAPIPEAAEAVREIARFLGVERG
jgi:monoterpene epsilon-lactone hydrolase